MALGDDRTENELGMEKLQEALKIRTEKLGGYFVSHCIFLVCIFVFLFGPQTGQCEDVSKAAKFVLYLCVRQSDCLAGESHSLTRAVKNCIEKLSRRGRCGRAELQNVGFPHHTEATRWWTQNCRAPVGNLASRSFSTLDSRNKRRDEHFRSGSQQLSRTSRGYYYYLKDFYSGQTDAPTQGYKVPTCQDSHYCDWYIGISSVPLEPANDDRERPTACPKGNGDTMSACVEVSFPLDAIADGVSVLEFSATVHN